MSNALRENRLFGKRLIFFKSRILFLLRIPKKDYLNPIKVWRIYQCRWNYSKLKYKRLAKLYELAEVVRENHIPGCFIECGVWKGGSAALVAKVLENRKSWLLDSWEGLPDPTIYDVRHHAGEILVRKKGDAAVGEGHVQEIFEKLHVRSEWRCVKGWFDDTLPKIAPNVGEISLLHLDADYYESTKVCLEYLYDKVALGGYIVLDDYNQWAGCKKAVDEFFARRKEAPRIIEIDNTGVYIRKDH